jgi:hypothetical protein
MDGVPDNLAFVDRVIVITERIIKKCTVACLQCPVLIPCNVVPQWVIEQEQKKKRPNPRVEDAAIAPKSNLVLLPSSTPPQDIPLTPLVAETGT